MRHKASFSSKTVSLRFLWLFTEIWQEAITPGGVTDNVPVVLVLNRMDMLANKLEEDQCQSFMQAFPDFKRDEGALFSSF